MSKSNSENAVLDRRRFYEIKFISRTDKNTEKRKTCFLKMYLENADLYKSVLNEIIIYEIIIERNNA